MRILPQLNPENEWFWTSGADGALRVQGCRECSTLVHPPTPICPTCRSTEWEPTPVSGRATVAGYTVNSHPWIPGFDPPYAVAVVALEESADVRFEAHDEIFVPLFEPTGENPVQEPELPTPRPAPTVDRYEHRAVLSGIGRSAIGRRLMRNPLSLTMDACLAAIADAGLTPDDIDGLATYPGAGGMGMSEGGVTAVEEAMRIYPTFISGGMDIPGAGGAILNVALAVSAGLVRHVLCFRTVWETTFAARGGEGAGVAARPTGCSGACPSARRRRRTGSA